MNNSQEQRASGHLRIALRRMAKSYPFHAHLLQPERFYCEPGVETMGVTIRDAQVQFWYAPDFVCGCDFDQLIGVLHHEVNHLLFGHLLAQTEDFPDGRARIIAEEVTANEWIVEPLPGQPIKLDQFPELPPLEDTATRYARLASDSEPSGRESVQSGRRNGPWVPKTVPSGQKTPLHVPPNAQSGSEAGLAPLDNHEIWKSARENRQVGKLVIQNAVRQAKQAMSQREWDAVSGRLGERIDSILIGTQSARLKQSIHTRPIGTINWKKLLRSLIARSTASSPALHRAPRRFPDLIGIVPGKSQSLVRHRVMAAIDTSGSMTAGTLEQIGGELRHLARGCDVTVVECDCEIHAEYRFRGNLTNVHGRGGTDLRPPFEYQVLARIRPDAIVYFTDGDGPAPAMPPKVPTIWGLTAASEAPAQWGHVVYVGDD